MQLQLKPLNLTATDRRPLLISGPCSAESEEQVLTTAHMLSDSGINIFRAGVWKPRTKPGCFEGHGEKALPWMKQVKAETGMKVATEVATPQHVEAALKAGIDILWIGARTTVNPFAVQELADSLRGTDIPILIKNPINPDLELWIGAIERLNRAGIQRLGVIHRGFSSYDRKLYRYQPMWQIPIELRRRIPDIPIICDPSHMGGRRDLIAPLSQQAMDLGMDGLIIESHCDPDNAWSDAAQQLTPSALSTMLGSLIIRNETQTTDLIALLRRQIDDIDNQIIEIIAHRMRICREIGQYKLEHDMTIFHPQRYSEMIERHEQQGDTLGVDKDFIREIFSIIHHESVREQIEQRNE